MMMMGEEWSWGSSWGDEVRQANSIAFAKLASSVLQTYLFVSGFTQLQNCNKLITFINKNTQLQSYSINWQQMTILPNIFLPNQSESAQEKYFRFWVDSYNDGEELWSMHASEAHSEEKRVLCANRNNWKLPLTAVHYAHYCCRRRRPRANSLKLPSLIRPSRQAPQTIFVLQHLKNFISNVSIHLRENFVSSKIKS